MMDEDLSLSDQTALVTGASSGIGRACALRLAAAGAAVVVNHYEDGQRAAEVAADIETAGARVLTVDADVSSADDVDRLFENARATFGTLDILVNNAGIQKDANVVDMSLGDWQRVIDVNLTGQFLCAQAAVKEFLRRGPRPELSTATGKIIFMSSIHQIIPWAGHVNYAASKGGIMMLMQSLAQGLAHHGIRINAVAPGAIKTPINETVWSDPEAREKLLQLIPYGRLGEPEDVAKAVHWLVSDLADYVTGESLVVGGGMRLYPEFIDNG